jgi:hypothetical protein
VPEARICGVVKGTTNITCNVRCQAETDHELHVGFNPQLGMTVEWENPGYIPKTPKAPANAGEVLADMAIRTSQRQPKVRGVIPEPDPGETCPTCGAKTVEYHHTLNAPLAQGLFRLAQADGPINLKYLGLSRNQWDNFQKLRYWSLAEQVAVDGKRKKGVWAITALGRNFVDGTARLPKRVWTYRGEFVRFEDGPLVAISDLVDTYQEREVWAAEAEARRPPDEEDA